MEWYKRDLYQYEGTENFVKNVCRSAQRCDNLEDLGAGRRKISKSGVWSGMKRLKEQM